MKKIVFGIQKGGVGKSTCACALSQTLGTSGKTILIDADPQGNSSEYMLKSLRGKVLSPTELADLFIQKSAMPEMVIREPKGKFTYSILPTSPEGNLDGVKPTLTKGHWKAVFDEVEKLGYEYCVIDTPPEKGDYVRGILETADIAISPILADYYSVGGIRLFQDVVRKAKMTNPELEFSKIILNNLNMGRALDKECVNELPKIFKDEFTLYNVPTDTGYSKCVSDHIPYTKKLLKPFEKLADDIRR